MPVFIPGGLYTKPLKFGGNSMAAIFTPIDHLFYNRNQASGKVVGFFDDALAGKALGFENVGTAQFYPACPSGR